MKTRGESLELASNKQFDVVVIGGGIAGAGVAYDAAARGLSVMLIEKDDFASGTSSRTTKLIHGGLRYLEQFHFKLTRELCAERGILERLAPHMVRDFSLIMPLPQGDWFFALKASLGLTIYDLLSMSLTHSKHERLSPKAVLDACPALSQAVIAGGLKFHDCITDDARMVIEVIKAASRHGALACNYLEVVGFELEGGMAKGVVCHDRISGKELTFSAKTVVNATGVWIDKLCQKLEPSWRRHVAPAKGIHIVVPASALDVNSALFLPTKDNRYVFVIPWQRALMIGTTDTPYSGTLENPLPTADEIDYLLFVLNGFTASQKLNRSDVIGSFAGLRPLVKPQGQTNNETSDDISREHIIFDGPQGIIGLTGGKLTNFRLMATEVVDRLAEKLPGIQLKPSPTKHLMLGNWLNDEDYLTTTAAISARARRLSVDPATIEHLIETFAKDADIVLDQIERDPSSNERICPDFPPVYAEIPFSIHEEMAVSLEDLLMRRLRLGILNQRQCLEAAPRVAKLMQSHLGWDNKRMDVELESLEMSLNEHLNVFAQALS